ncbi:Origin recognition complex subunit 3 [Entomortierella lignicola]|nr:Origin recognition complex subunit 3 [Entomortierella lignicola]
MQQCPVFADTLQTRADSSSIVHILVDIDPSALQLIINFIYLNQIEEPGNVRVVDWHYIFQLARRFRLDRLANRALEEMARSQWGHQHLDYEEIEAVFLVLPKNDSNKGKAKNTGVNSTFKRNLFKLDGFQQLRDVDESWEATEIRHALFNKEWEHVATRIENVMLNMNTIALSAIYDFVDNAYSTKMTRAVMPFQELPTGLIFAGINVPDHDLLFQQIARTVASLTPPSLDTDKNETSLSTDKSNSYAGLKLPTYDMVVLERWYKSLCELKGNNHHRKNPTLVVIVQDFESFDQDVLQDLITICSNYLDRIPFVFLMGLATSIDALHQGLPKSVLGLLQTRKFQMQQSSECLTAVIHDLFIHANAGLMVGPLPLKQLIDQFMHYNFSIGGFVANLKYIVMHHYYANPLSILCDRYLKPDSKALDLLKKGHFDHIRMLPSFQKYVESKIESDHQVAEMLVLDDEFLTLQIPDLISDIQEYHRNFATVFDFLWFLQSRFSIAVLKKSKRALYFMALEGILVNSSNITFLLNLVRKMDSNSMITFIEDCLIFFESIPYLSSTNREQQGGAMKEEIVILKSIRDRLVALLDVVSEDSDASSSDNEDGDHTDLNVENEGEDENSEKVSQVSVPDRWTKVNASTVALVKKKKLVSVKANVTDGRQTKIAKKTRETVRIPKGALGTYTVLVTEIDQFFDKLFKTYLDCHVNVPLYEIFYYSQVKIQQKAFLPQPRASIQTALGQPEIYLNCDCCHPPPGTKDQLTSQVEMVLPTQHDTCILYKLYVECGRMINMYDWFTAFGMILERGNVNNDSNEDEEVHTPGRARKRAKLQPKKAAKKKQGDEQDDAKKKEGLDQKEVQARFISGVAELQFMGFIKPTNRKTDHVMRLTWGNI